MSIPIALDENLRFLVLEVTKQLDQTLEFIKRPTQRRLEDIDSRDDYIDGLKGLIEEKSFSLLSSTVVDRKQANLIRSVNIIATNLERIADFAGNVAAQVKYFSDPAFINAYDYKSLFVEIDTGLKTILPALNTQDLSRAFRICHCEFSLDAMYKTVFDRLLMELSQGERTGDLVTVIFIFRYLERMGDSLLNIGEAILFAAMGERLKIHQYQALHDSLAESGMNTPISEVEFESIWGTRSGCRIGKVADKRSGGEENQRVIFKEGQAAKLRRESENIATWQKIMPGLPPRVFGFHQNGDSASILLEYLEGCTLQDIILTQDRDMMEDSLYLLTENLGQLWQETKRDQPSNAGHMRQLRRRLADVYRVHPDFRRPGQRIGGLTVATPEDMLRQAQELEPGLSCPFSVFIHGDFNVNNIIYDHQKERIHYLDLHRSAYSDYVQDVSVFLVSNFRLPVENPALRRRLNQVTADFLAFARGFAAQNQDELFEARLALGLVRSLITSTRFELNQRFAKQMFLRGLYLLEKLTSFGGEPWTRFKVPDPMLAY